MPRPLAPHGTAGAYNRHKRAHERVCDRCQSWKDAERLDKAVTAPKKGPKPLGERFDFAKETLASINLVRTALAQASPAQVSSLTKRKSELLAEYHEYLVEAGQLTSNAPPPEVDPLDAALDSGLDLSNVTRIAG